MDREHVHLALDDDFTPAMRRAATASRRIRRALAETDATWEPHDWSDFD